MGEWKEYRFSDFIEINPTVKLSSNELISFVEMKDLDSGKRFCYPSSERINGSGSKFEGYDTLFARITPCLENGKICQVKGLKNNKGLGSTEFLVFRGKEKISDTNFVFYLSRWDDVRSHAEINLDGTSGRQRVSRACFDDLLLKLPTDVKEKRAIAFVLGSLDDKIDLLHRQNATLEKMAETLFRQWFVEEAKDDWEDITVADVAIINQLTKNINYEHLTFLTTYIVPLVCFNFESIRYKIVFLVLFVAVGAIYIRADLFYANPTLAVLQFRIYKISGKFRNGENRSNIVLICREKLQIEDNVRYFRLDDRIYFAYKVKSNE